MFINIESATPKLVDSVYRKIKSQFPGDEIVTEPLKLPGYKAGEGVHVVATTSMKDLKFGSVADERWAHLWLASQGARFWVDEGKTPSLSPIYAPEIKGMPDECDQIIVDAVYAETKAKYFSSFGVNYLGRTYVDPRTIVLVDYKGDKQHIPAGDTFVRDILESLPEGGSPQTSWASFGIVSTGNVDKLDAFLDHMASSNVLAYSTGAMAKLRFLGRDFGQVTQPKPDRDYGIHLRETSSRMRLSD